MKFQFKRKELEVMDGGRKNSLSFIPDENSRLEHEGINLNELIFYLKHHEGFRVIIKNDLNNFHSYCPDMVKAFERHFSDMSIPVLGDEPELFEYFDALRNNPKYKEFELKRFKLIAKKKFG